MMKLIPYTSWNRSSWKESVTKESRKKWGSTAVFLLIPSRANLVLRTLHDLLRNKEALSSLKYQISPTSYLQIYCEVCPQMAGTRSVYCYIMQSAVSSGNSNSLQCSLFTLLAWFCRKRKKKGKLWRRFTVNVRHSLGEPRKFANFQLLVIYTT